VVLILSVTDSDKESSGGLWLVMNFLALCAVTAVAIPHVVRARTCRCSNACVNNLRQMDGAMQQWALENRKMLEYKIAMADITPYLKNPLVCPQGGTYKIGPAVSNAPTCSIKGHSLPP